jgi:mannitol-1-phosphate/altronate dehydrogenase
MKKEERRRLLKEVFFCNTLVDRVCATISCCNDEVEVPVEGFHSWVVSDPGPSVPALDLLLKTGMIHLAGELEFSGYEVQKYWCMNGVHLAAAAYAFNADQNLKYFHNALAVKVIREKIEALQQELALAFLMYVARKGLLEHFPYNMVTKFNRNVLRRLDKNRTDMVARVLKQQGPTAVGVIEMLDRIERLLAPQCEIIANRKQLVDPRYEQVALYRTRKKIPRLELDDAITQVVLAMRRFASEYPDRE